LYADLIRKTLDSGRYTVIAGVFDRNGTRTASKTWETEKLDNELSKRFMDRETIRVPT
jgi:hypothetical protein